MNKVVKMNKYPILIFFIFYSQTLVFSNDSGFLWTIGDVGYSTNFINQGYFEFSGPEFLLKTEKNTFYASLTPINVGFDISYNKSSSEDNVLDVGEFGLLWSPLHPGEYCMFGPKISGGFHLMDDSGLYLNAGIAFSWLYDEHFFLKNLSLDYLPQSLAFKIIDVEVGYSILDHTYYVQISTDLSIFLLLLSWTFQQDYNTNLKENSNNY